MPNDLVTAAWAPGVIGLGISNFMFGASLAQSVHYVYHFPEDPSPIKLLVFLIFMADAFHLVGGNEFFWDMLVLCHQSDTRKCDIDLSWGIYPVILMNYMITFVVQSFYGHRIWIMSGNKRSITMAVLLIAILQFALGLGFSIEALRDGTIKYIYTSPLVPIAAGVSTLCDILITSTVFKYLWKSELRGRSNVLRDLVIVFINMGALTCLISIIVVVVYLAQGDNYWVGAPAIVLSRCYVNSFLAVLNARRGLRAREQTNTIEIPSLPTIR